MTRPSKTIAAFIHLLFKRGRRYLKPANIINTFSTSATLKIIEKCEIRKLSGAKGLKNERSHLENGWSFKLIKI